MGEIPDTAAPQVEVEVGVMDVVTADPMDELFIDQSNKVIAPHTDQVTKSMEGGGNDAMEVEVKDVSTNGVEEKKGQVEGGEGAEGVEKKVILSEGKTAAEVVRDVEKEEEEEDREFLKHLDAAVHKDLCLVYLVSQQVPPFLLCYLSSSLSLASILLFVFALVLAYPTLYFLSIFPSLPVIPLLLLFSSLPVLPLSPSPSLFLTSHHSLPPLLSFFLSLPHRRSCLLLT